MKILGINILDKHSKYIESEKPFTLLVYNNKYHFSTKKFLNNCLNFKYLVKDFNDNDVILSFEHYYHKNDLFNGSIYLRQVNCSKDCGCSYCSADIGNCYHPEGPVESGDQPDPMKDNCIFCCGDKGTNDGTGPDCLAGPSPQAPTHQSGQWCPDISPTP